MSNLFNHYSHNPTSISITRGRFDLSHNHKTTFHSGQLVPFKVIECLPGDTFSLDRSVVCNMSTPIVPVMDNAYFDEFWFFVPSRLVWDHTKEFYGENTSGPWDADVEYTIPQISFKHLYPGTFYDQMCIPSFEMPDVPNAHPISFDARPIRAYGLIWNEWFRNQNVSAPVFVPTDDSDLDFEDSSDDAEDIIEPSPDPQDWISSGYFLPVVKYADRFTTALPEPQKGPAVELPFAQSEAPVFGDGLAVTFMGQSSNTSGVLTSTNGTIGFSPYEGSLASYDMLAMPTKQDFSTTHLHADLSEVTSISVNTLRQLFAMQRLYEADAIGGTRFREILKTHFHVTVADERVQIPEYLCGRQVPISMNAVPQTSGSVQGETPQGNLSAYSHTTDKQSMFTYSVTEPGFIMCVGCVRTNNTYSQGLHPMWTRKRRFDFYWPTFANIGNTPIYNRELYCSGLPVDDEVFGFQEAWAEYRTMHNTVAGRLVPQADNKKIWTYADELHYTPTLSPQFIYQRDVISQTLAADSVYDAEFYIDFRFKITAVRPMPVYSIPGFSSHL